MTGKVILPEDARPEKPGILVTLADGIMTLANVAATVWILMIMVVILADVLGRELFLKPLAGVPEMVKYSIVGIVFLQIAHTHRRGEMIRSDGILTYVGEWRPRIAAGMDLFSQIAGMVLSLCLAWAVWPKAMKALSRGEMEGVQGHFQMPVWPFLAIVALGSVLLALSFLLSAIKAYHNLRAGRR